MADHRTVSGTIARIVDDCGFIARDGVEYWFHRTAVDAPARFEHLRVGQDVRFEEASSTRPRARRVIVEEARR